MGARQGRGRPGCADLRRHVEDAQLASDQLHIDVLALVGEARIASDDEQPANAGECCNDLLDHAVGEIFLLRVAAHIGEGQYRDRRLVRERQRRRQWALGRIANPVDPHRPGDVLDLLLAQILEEEG
jgi:hypothetical protein